MAAIVWDQIGSRQYETGVDRGVLYSPDGDGVPWNGLVSVDQLPGITVEPLHFDGLKYNDFVTIEDFKATLRAFTYPDEFLMYEGIVEYHNGLFVTGQNPEQFHLCYRTLIGNDVNGNDEGYKIHILYNLTAVPSTKSYQTLSLEPTPSLFEWNISSIPEEVAGYQPTAHIILNSQKLDPWLLEDIEVILYGDDTHEPHLPEMEAFLAFVRKWDRLIITDNGDGTWTATSARPGIIEMLSADEFQITSDTAVYLDADTYEISSSAINEEDL